MSEVVDAPCGVVARRMRWWDLAEVLALERALFAADAWTIGMFLSELADWRGRWYVVACDATSPDGAVVGYAGLHTYGKESYVNTIAVAPQRRRRGVGGFLLDVMIARARSRGAVTMGLEVAASGEAAQLLYASRDFEAVGLRRGYYAATGEDAVVMVTQLDLPDRS